MTMPIQDVMNAIYIAILASGTVPTTIFYYPNAPRPPMPYSAIQYEGGGNQISDWVEFDQATNITEQWGFRELTFMIHVYGDDAAWIANSQMAFMMTQTIRDLLRKSGNNCGMSVLRTRMVLNTIELIDDKFEQRATYELTVNVNLENGTTGYGGGYFDKVAPITWTNKPPQ